ncbi:MAG: SRPBCC domain-containing protein [Chitinophagales bacterium]|nr:SRPBCC domain-containing protein [Chitinophagales bacterium]
MSPDNFNWKEFHHSVILNSSGEKVYNLISTADGLEKWFLGEVSFFRDTAELRKTAIVQPEDKYRWEWLTKSFSSSGTVIDITDNSVSYTFGESFIITFRIEELNDRCKLVLHQKVNTVSEDDQFAYLNCAVCWVFFLTNIKSVIEYDIDLREKEVVDEALVNQ